MDNNNKKQQKKILIFSALDVWSMGKKSGAQSLWKTLEGYANNNYKVFFITSNKEPDSIYNLHENIEIIRFKIPYLKDFQNIKYVCSIVHYIYWLIFQIKSFIIAKKIIKKNKIDIFYGYEVAGTPIAHYLAKKYNTLCVSRFQGTIIKPDSIEKIPLFSLKQLHTYGMKQQTDLIIMTDDGTQGDKVLNNLNQNMEKVKFWKNGVDIYHTPDFDKKNILKKYNIPNDRFIIVSVSRLANWKRVDRTIKALYEVIKEKTDFHFIVVGGGPEKTTLEELTKKLSLNDHITFTGALEHQFAQEITKCADLFISMYDLSNVGNPLLETLKIGKPIITLNNGDTSRVITNGYNGILLNTSEINLLSEKILEIINDKDLRLRLSENAKIYASKELWTWEERINTEIQTVEELLCKYL